MSPPDVALKSQFKMGDWHVDVQSNTLRRGDQVVTLEPRVMSLLAFLCQHQGQTLSKDVILENVWGSTHFADSVVARAVSLLRQSLGDTPGDPRYIQTIPRRGYRWIAPVEQIADEPVQARRTQNGHSAGLIDTIRIPLIVALLVTALSVSVFIVLGRTKDNRADLPSVRVSIIAMMPFTVEAAPEALRYLVDGLQEDIVMQLSRHQSLRLAELPSNVDDRLEAARALGASAVLSGTIDLNEQEITVRLALQNPENSAQYWSETFSEPIETVQQLRNRIVAALLAKSHLDENREDRLIDAVRTVDADAYQAHLEARWYSRQRSYASMERGETLFEQLTITHPGFAAGHAGLALSYIVRVSYFDDDPEAGYARADAAATQALLLDPHNAEALTAKAQVLFHRDWDFAAAAAYLQQAIEASPGEVDARQYLAELYSVTNQHALALTVIDDALERQPYSLLLMGVKGILLCASGDYEASIEQLKDLERYSPSFNWQYRYWGYAHERLGQPVEAALAKTKRFRSNMSVSENQSLVDQIHDTQGMAYWQWVQTQTTHQSRPHTAIAYFARAEWLAVNGQLDEAMVWLEKTIQRRGQVFLLLRISPALDAIRERPDYRRLLALHGVPIHQPGRRLDTLTTTRPR